MVTCYANHRNVNPTYMPIQVINMLAKWHVSFLFLDIVFSLNNINSAEFGICNTAITAIFSGTMKYLSLKPLLNE